MFKKMFNFEKKPKLSLVVFLIFILVFVSAGLYLIYRSLAVAPLDIMSSSLYTPSGKSIERIYGPDRYSTAVGISKYQFPLRTGGRVIIATGEDWPDAVPGAVLARAYDAPILLTPRTYLNTETKAELQRLRPANITVLGGTTSVSATVYNAIKSSVSGVNIERIAGSNRYETASLIADRIYAIKGNSIPDQRAIIATGAGYADVLSASSLAAAKGYPILLTEQNALPVVTKNQIAKMGIQKTLVIGGTGAISDTVKNQLPAPVRLFGATRYETSKAVVNWAANNISLTYFSKLGVVSGENFPDALSAAPFIASPSSGLLILSPPNINATIRDYLNSKKTYFSKIYVFGGVKAISSSTYGTLANFIGYGFTQDQITAQTKVDYYAQKCPILSGTVVYFGDAQGYQAVAYYRSGKIVISPDHTATLDRIINHEIYHIYDWRDNGAINWNEKVPPTPKPSCMP